MSDGTLGYFMRRPDDCLAAAPLIEVDGVPTPLFCDPKLGHDDEPAAAERFSADLRSIQRREGLAPS